MKIPFSKPKVKYQILVIFLLCSTIPIAIFGIYAINSARKEMLRQYEAQLDTDAIRVNSTLFDITTSVKTSTANIIDTTDCSTLFGNIYSINNEIKYNYLSTSLDTYRDNTASIESINIYTDNPSIPSCSYISYISEGFENTSWYKAAGNSPSAVWYSNNSTDKFGTPTYSLTLVQKLAVVNSPYHAFLVTVLDTNYLRNRLLTNDNLVMISIDDNPIFFSSDRGIIWEDMPFPDGFDMNGSGYTGNVSFDGTKYLSSIIRFQPYQTYNNIYSVVIDKTALTSIDKLTYIYLSILALAILFPMILIYVFSNHFSNRVQILKSAMHQASIGNYNIIDTFYGDDELTETFSDLKKTVDLIHQKESAMYQEKISEQKLINNQQQMEFKMLASQINPHFLYNTLETIRMQAIASDNRNVSDSIKLLGKTLHYVLENTGTDSTTLAKEFEHIENYMKIQKLRFGDRVNYTIEASSYLNLDQFKVLPLLLQPIIENAIVHGLEETVASGMIEVSVYLEEPNLYVTVHDNGSGIDSDTLEKLNASFAGKSESNIVTGSSIGLRNINQRLILLYGMDYHLRIESTLDEGSLVTLTLPLEKIVDKDDLSDMIKRREDYYNEIDE